MEEHRVDLIEKFLTRAQPDWRDIARGKEPVRRPLAGNEFIAAPGAAHEDMIIDEDQTRRDRIALGYELPDGRDENGNLIEGGDDGAPGPDPDAAERGDLWDKLERFRGKDGYNVPADDASTDQLRAAVAAAEERERALADSQKAASTETRAAGLAPPSQDSQSGPTEAIQHEKPTTGL
jgi:hypothetical protein